MDSSSETRPMDLFPLVTSVIATIISFSSVTEVIGRPDLGTLLTEPHFYQINSLCSKLLGVEMKKCKKAPFYAVCTFKKNVQMQIRSVEYFYFM